MLSRLRELLQRSLRDDQRQMAPSGACALPARTLVSLEHIFGASVAGVRVVEHSRHWTFWLPGFVATTRPGRIYLRGSIDAFLHDPALVLEEYYHVIRQWDTGRLTRWRYVCEALCRGYARNAFEIEAKRFARERIGCYQPPEEVLSARAPGRSRTR
jgi:hypothetical protein